MRGARGGVVAVGAKMAAVLGRIAADDVALHAVRHEAVRLEDFRRHAAADAALDRPDQFRIFDLGVLAALVRGVVHRDGAAVDLAHEAGFLAAAGFVMRDQAAAELGLEHVRQEQHRGLQLQAGMARRLRQRREKVEHARPVRTVMGERDVGDDAHHRVEHQPETARLEAPVARPRLARDRAVEPAHHSVEIEDVPQARQQHAGAAFRLVARVEADPEEAGAHVVEQRAVRLHGVERRAGLRIAERRVEAQHEVAPGGGVEGVARIAGRPLREPWRGIAARKEDERSRFGHRAPRQSARRPRMGLMAAGRKLGFSLMAANVRRRPSVRAGARHMRKTEAGIEARP